MDLRVRLGFPPVKMGETTRFMVVEFDGHTLVLVVDAVKGVEALPTEAWEDVISPEQEISITPYEEVGLLDNKVVRLLDLVGLVRVA
jgi:chemotaxis signal transduction protein